MAKGFNKKYEIDYFEIFVPIAKMNMIRLIFALATIRGSKMNQLDVNNTFLNGDP